MSSPPSYFEALIKKDERTRLFCAAVLIGIALFALFCSKNILTQGQEIKQFHAFAVTRALVDNGFSVFKTYLPCEDVRNHTYPRPWAEEPPVFHLFAAALQRLGLTAPQWPSFLISLGTCLLCFAIVYYHFPGPERSRPALLLLSLGTPVFLRYFSEHLPDGLSVFFMALSVLAYLQKKRGLMFLAALLAVTVKAYAFFPAASFFFWVFVVEPNLGGRQKHRWIFDGGIYAVACAFLVLPFAAWVISLEHLSIPNPFNFTNPVQNRHSGSWSILGSREYWDRVFTFMGTKGVGWPLFIGFFGFLARKRWRPLDPYHGALLFWALSFIPFWLLVRAASIFHDHYVLQYFFPMALLGAEAICRIPIRSLRYALIMLSLGIGFSNPLVWRLRVTDRAPSSYCDQEEHSLRRFPLPSIN